MHFQRDFNKVSQ